MLVLDTLRDDAQPERVREVHHRADPTSDPSRPPAWSPRRTGGRSSGSSTSRSTIARSGCCRCRSRRSRPARRGTAAPRRSSTGTTRDRSAQARSVISTSSRFRRHAVLGEQPLDGVDDLRRRHVVRGFTATGVVRPSCDHCASWRTHAVSANRVTSWMRPDCSASGMNAAGASRPRVSCRQRMSASSPTVRPVVQVDLRLVVHLEDRASRGSPRRARGAGRPAGPGARGEGRPRRAGTPRHPCGGASPRTSRRPPSA